MGLEYTAFNSGPTQSIDRSGVDGPQLWLGTKTQTKKSQAPGALLAQSVVKEGGPSDKRLFQID